MQHIDYSQYSLNDLFILVKGSDKDAFDCLYRFTFKGLYELAYRKLQDEDVAKEIVQDLFVDLWDKREQKHIHEVEKYLYQVVRFKVIDVYRRRRVSFAELDGMVDTLVDYTNQADTPFYTKQLKQYVNNWIETLPKKRKKIFQLRYHEDKSTGEISKILDISPKTVQNQLLTTANALRGLLQKYLLLILLFFFGS
ncbi:RNA polymerase sigma factor [Sphingobacterium sp. Mn56C]|uniref:RNA polymerase sigma factor n=1 Tax=Sphingobacterium sp. Mn56C TaxID=3395261 RepID=UPI003BE588D2